MKIAKSKVIIGAMSCLILTCAGFGQGAKPDEALELAPGQTHEREMTGAATHRYKFTLKVDEFFQARIEQKGIDVILNLFDADGNVLATMDSLNGKEGFETLSFVAEKDGSYCLETISPNEKAGKATYIIKREESRKSSEDDKKRVEAEKYYVEIIRALIWREGQQLLFKSKKNITEARLKFNVALSIRQAISSKTHDKSLLEIVKDTNVKPEQIPPFVTLLHFLSLTQHAGILVQIADTYKMEGDWDKSIAYRKTAVEIHNGLTSKETFSDSFVKSFKLEQIQIQNEFGEALNFINLGDQLSNQIYQRYEAVKYLNQGLELFRALYQTEANPQFKYFEALTLVSIGSILRNEVKDKSKGYELIEKAIEIHKSLPFGKNGVASNMSLLASYYISDYEIEKALNLMKDALTIYQETGNLFGQSSVLYAMSTVYLSFFDDKPKARELINQNLKILHSPGFNESYRKSTVPFTSTSESLGEIVDDETEYRRLLGIGDAHADLEEYERALEFYEKALPIAKKNNDSPKIGITLLSIANAYYKLEDWNNAVKYYGQTLEVSRKRQSKSQIAGSLSDYGAALVKAGKPREALKYLHEALQIHQEIGLKEKRNFSVDHGFSLNFLSQGYYALGNRKTAIFYGKQTINAFQTERRKLQGLEVELQKGYLRIKEKSYRRVAEWLIEDRRIVEAEQVLAMLKDEEVSSYLRGDLSEANKLQRRTDLKPEEKDALTRYNEIGDRIAAIGAEYDKLRELRKAKTLTGEQQKRYEELATKVQDSNNIFQAFLKQLADEFAKRRLFKKDLEEDLALQSQLKEWGDGVVFLYTLVGEDRYRVILTTPKVKTDGKSEIKSVDLDRKISDFRQIVQNPKLDPRPLGKELYDILIKPLEKQLDGAKAKTLLWSLDGNLRLLPLSALWDGRQYFGQKYQNVIFTAASRSRLSETNSPTWRVLGMGVSEPRIVAFKELDGTTRNIRFPELPAVRTELAKIVADANDCEGILPGCILLNSEFNKKNFTDQLFKGYKAIHIASHFDLNAGDAAKSFLLLGDGNALTVSEIKADPDVSFEGVDLLTLSACQTAVGEKDTNGKEVEGFGYVAQQKGAKAILATLWSVVDESTSLFMSEFYRLRKENPKLTKSEAIQLAQIALIEGKLKSEIDGNPKGAEIVSTANKEVKAPPFEVDKERPFAHPFYWSPFILIGNWR